MQDHVTMIREAERHLTEVEPRLGAIIAAHGPCPLTPDRDVYGCIIRSVVSQMISVKAASSISARIEQMCSGKIIPKRIAGLSVEQLRLCGLSNSKCVTIHAVTDLFSKSKNLNDKIHESSDDEVRDMLLHIKGIGPWTVHMLMIFCLVRPDVWPVADLGIQSAVQDVFKLRTRPDPKRLEKISKPWAPYRTIAAWHLWHHRDSSKVY